LPLPNRSEAKSIRVRSAEYTASTLLAKLSATTGRNVSGDPATRV
jgi:hypothetical protein